MAAEDNNPMIPGRGLERHCENRRRSRTSMWVIAACIFVLAANPLLVAQQIHTGSGGESEDGKRLFVANCAPCHGPDGNAIAGVDFGHGKFRRASSDRDVPEIIRSGIPGTAMPAFSSELSEVEIRRIAAYLHDLAGTAQSTSAPGDAERGKTIFEGNGKCLLGELERSILDPDAEILPQNRFVRVVTQDEVTITGRLLNQDTFTVQLIDSKERLRSFEKSKLKEYVFLDKSPMASYQGKLNPRELADLVSYLVSLKRTDSR
jgi:mono/diheme cytochrome c family protein